jgi:hypothetical protein
MNTYNLIPILLTFGKYKLISGDKGQTSGFMERPYWCWARGRNFKVSQENFWRW